MTPIAPRTIADFITCGFALTAYCSDAIHCNHGAGVTLRALADRLGKDFDLYRLDLRQRFRCTACGHRGATFIVSPS